MSSGRLMGTIVGLANGPNMAPVTQVAIRVNPPAVIDQFIVNTPSSSLLSQMSIGQTIPIYIALTSADQTAIEGAVTVTPFETND